MKTFSEFKIDILEDDDLDEKVVKREKRTAQQKRDQKSSAESPRGPPCGHALAHQAYAG